MLRRSGSRHFGHFGPPCPPFPLVLPLVRLLVPSPPPLLDPILTSAELWSFDRETNSERSVHPAIFFSVYPSR